MRRVLVVEGDATARRSVERILAESFHDMDLVLTKLAIEAEAELAKHSFDLIIVDQHLPTRSGRKFLDDNAAHIGDTPIVMLTAFPADKAGREGIDWVVPRPLKPEDLRAAVQAALGIGL